MNKYSIYDLRRHDEPIVIEALTAYSAMKEVFHYSKFQRVESYERYNILVVNDDTEEKSYFQLIQ